MWISRQTLRTFISLALGTQFLVACLPSPQDKGNAQQGATFTARAAADKSKVLDSAVKGAFAFPYEKVYNFQACLKGIAHQDQIAGHEFYIVETKSIVTSDKEGCITWPEKYEFNYLGESKYVKIERTIEGRGLHKGQQKIAFAINPWSHGETLAPVLNPDDGNEIPALVEDPKAVEQSLKGFNKEGAKVTRPLWVEDGRLFVTEQKMTKQGIELLVEMRPNVTLLLTKMNGELASRALTAGKFKANLQLIHVYQHGTQEIRRILSGSEDFKTEFQNGSLSVKSVLTLGAIPTRGQMLLALQLSPLEGPDELKPFEGLYLLGEYDQIKVTAFLKLHTTASQTPNFKISDYANSTMTQPKFSGPNNDLDAETYQKPKIEVSQLEFRFIRVGEERTTTREVIYSIRACLRNGLDQKNTRSHTFKVTKFKQKESDQALTTEVKTDNNSCLNWDERIEFKYFDCQHYIPGFIQIQNEDLGMNEKMSILVNPWESNGGAIARDVRYVDPTEKTLKDCTIENRPRTQLLMDSYAYNALSYDYKVDALLGLELHKKFQFRIEPRVLTYSSLSNGRSESARLRDGIYLLRLVVVQNRDYSKDLNNYIDSQEILVNVINGQINTEVTFVTSELKALGNRNNILLQIFPVTDEKVQVNGNQILPAKNETLKSIVDKTTGLESPIFVGPILLNADDASRPVKILESQKVSQYLLSGQGDLKPDSKISLDEIIANGKSGLNKIKTSLHKKARKQEFAVDNNLQLISLRQEQGKNLQEILKSTVQKDQRFFISKSELQQFVNSGSMTSVLAQKLCAFWVQDYFKRQVPGQEVLRETVPRFGFDCYQASRKDPSNFFNWEKRLLVKQLASFEMLEGINQGLNIGTSFSLTYSDSNSFSRSFSMGAKGGASLKFLKVGSIGLDLGYNINWNRTQSRSGSNSMSINGNTSLMMQQNNFQLKLQRYEQCVLVRLNPELFMAPVKTGWLQRSYNYSNILNTSIPEESLAQAVTRGFMVCDGVDKTDNLQVIENYYLISQETYAAQMQDSGDARNRQFFLGLRSHQDFENFVVATKSEITTPNGAKASEASSETSQPLLKLIKSVAPQSPGMLRVPPTPAQP